MMHPCSVCGLPDEEHADGMCCEGCTCTEEPEPWSWQPDTVEEARGDK